MFRKTAMPIERRVECVCERTFAAPSIVISVVGRQSVIFGFEDDGSNLGLNSHHVDDPFQSTAQKREEQIAFAIKALGQLGQHLGQSILNCYGLGRIASE